jgi:hypothetical protein
MTQRAARGIVQWTLGQWLAFLQSESGGFVPLLSAFPTEVLFDGAQYDDEGEDDD